MSLYKDINVTLINLVTILKRAIFINLFSNLQILQQVFILLGLINK